MQTGSLRFPGFWTALRTWEGGPPSDRRETHRASAAMFGKSSAPGSRSGRAALVLFSICS